MTDHPVPGFWATDPSFVFNRRKVVLYSEYEAVYDANLKMEKQLAELRREAADWERAARALKKRYEGG